MRPSIGELSEHISEVGQRWDFVLCAGAHEAVENGGASRGVMRATEEIVASTESDGPHLLLTDIIVKTQASIVDEAIESRPVVE